MYKGNKMPRMCGYRKIITLTLIQSVLFLKFSIKIDQIDFLVYQAFHINNNFSFTLLSSRRGLGLSRNTKDFRRKLR